jgi:hypothetical protein
MTGDPLVLLDPNDLTLGELEEIEDYAGYEALARMLAGVFSPRVLVVLTYLTAHRANPAVTLAEVRGWNLERIDVEGKKPARKPRPKVVKAAPEEPDPNVASSAG